MRRFIISLLLVFFYDGLKSQNTDTLTLDICLRAVVNNSPLSRQLVHFDEILKNKIGNLNTNWYPSVGINAQANYNSEAIDFSDINLPGGISLPSSPLDQYKIWTEINQQLYDGGVVNAQKAIERAGNGADRKQTESELLKIRQQVSKVFFSLIITRKNSEILRISLEELSQRKKIIQSGVNHGIILSENIMAVEAEQILLEQKITELSLSSVQLVNILSILIDSSLNSEVALIEPVLISGDEPYTERPEFIMFDKQKELLLANQQLVSSSDRPKLFAFSQLAYGRPGYNFLNDDFHTFYTVGVGMKWNFLNYGDSKRQKKIFEIQKYVVEIRRENFEDQLNIQLQTERTDMEKYDAFMLQDEKILDLRKSIAAASLSRLNNGTITATDYLTDMNAEIMAKLQYENHKILKMQAVCNSLLLKGKL
jgi:hypothetical protein